MKLIVCTFINSVYIIETIRGLNDCNIAVIVASMIVCNIYLIVGLVFKQNFCSTAILDN